ncbi:unnamed protein product, partial [Cyprideis torosa]
QFCLELNVLVVALQQVCFPSGYACIAMVIQEEQVINCLVHGPPNLCPAIDYARHMLDGASGILNARSYFPNRAALMAASVATFPCICRRLYRIFSHAYFYHGDVFKAVEVD